MPIVRAAKKIAVSIERFFVYRVLSLDDTPHRIALGVAIGIFVTWTPTIGLQMILTVALAALLRANKIVGLPFVWISNPATIFPIYYPNYWLGCRMLGKSPDAFNSIMNAASLGGGWKEQTFEWARAVMHIFWELWLGSIIVGLVLGIISYFVIYFLVVNYRKGLHALQEHIHHHKDETAPADETTDRQQEADATESAQPEEEKPAENAEVQKDVTDERQAEQPGQPEDDASGVTETVT